MASILAHAAIPWVTRKTVPPTGLERRLGIVAVVCAVWPDADLVSVAFEVRPNEPLGHRGLTHSLVVAAIVAGIAALAGFRALRIGSRAWWRTFGFLFAVSASHGLLDTATPGDTGVALLAPFTNARFAFPLKIVPACPMGINEYLGWLGVLTFANEILFIVIPLALVVSFIGKDAPRLRLAAVTVGWAIMAFALRTTWPEWFAPRMPRVLMAAKDMSAIPHDDLPDARLITRLTDLRALDLFDRVLVPTVPAWSSSFFPSWFGGESGRWVDGSPRLVWRTLFGFSPPTEDQAHAWLAGEAAGDVGAQRALFGLAPTEKVDLALGHFDFPATKTALGFTHNAKPKPRYWHGRCAGVAAAAVNLPEPFRVVDVIAKDGSHVLFHPNDIKALLAVAYNKPDHYTLIGDECGVVAFDAGAKCSMNPALFVVAVLNRIGIGKHSLVVDVLPTVANQYYAVASVRVHASQPRTLDRTPMEAALVGKGVSLVDVAIDLTLSSTTLAYSRANVLDASDSSGTRYRRVGVVSVPFTYTATLVIAANGELVGGRWTGDPPDGPDNLVVVSDTPKVEDDGMLYNARSLPWAFLRELARVSADDSAPLPTVDLR